MTVTVSPGYLCFFINAHLPYMAPLTANTVYQDNWLCNTLFNSYLPILELFDRLAEEGIPYCVNLSISPVVMEMIASPAMAERFSQYLQMRWDNAQQELGKMGHSSPLRPLAQHFADEIQHRIELFRERYQGRVLATINRLVHCGHLELLAASATGAYLPLLGSSPSLAWGQIKVGCQSYTKYFSSPPRGFWSFDGGYTPEISELLYSAGIRYTLAPALCVLGGVPRPQAATFRPIVAPDGLIVFGEDIETKLDILHSRTGFINNPEYLRTETPAPIPDAASKSAKPPVQSHIYSQSYYSRARSGEHQQIYNFQQAMASAKLQAQTFIENRCRQTQWVAQKLGTPAVITLALPAEMFGQSWYEGIIWLEEVLRLLAQPDIPLQSSHFSSLCHLEPLQQCTPNSGSANAGSFSANWLNERSSWIYKHNYLAGQRLLKMAKIGHQRDDFKRRLINQAARELMLAQSSDWPTLLSNDLDSKAARKEVRRHLAAFHKLFDDFREGRADEAGLRKLEERCPIFPDLSYEECYLELERSQKSMPTNQPELNSSAAAIDKDEIIAGILQIQKVTRELAVLCQQALATDKDVSLDISAKACESVAIVEDLARRARDPHALQRYLDTTTKLENIIKIIADTNDTQELLDLHREAIEAVDAWADTVESLLKSIIAQAK
ncbi:MAG: DUF1957 domain-containing protein [bacterium]|nr:DUF1957 domain-containing protein [bacterium]